MIKIIFLSFCGIIVSEKQNGEKYEKSKVQIHERALAEMERILACLPHHIRA